MAAQSFRVFVNQTAKKEGLGRQKNKKTEARIELSGNVSQWKLNEKGCLRMRLNLLDLPIREN